MTASTLFPGLVVAAMLAACHSSASNVKGTPTPDGGPADAGSADAGPVAPSVPLEVGSYSAGDGKFLSVAVSINGSPQALQLIKDGDMTATVWQPAYEEGKQSFQAILDSIAAGSSWQPKVISIPGIVVTKENIDKFLADHPNGL